MPTYEYVCDGCSHEFEIFQSMKDNRLKTCPECEEDRLRRKIGTGAGIIFKGSGFYETDYKRNSKPESKEGGGKESGGSEGSGKSEGSSGSSGDSSSGSSSKPDSGAKGLGNSNSNSASASSGGSAKKD
jgi:putative FmdB family regulatory protein